MGRKRSREPCAQPARRWGPTRRSTSELKETPVVRKIGYIAARRTGRRRGPAVRRPGTPPPSQRTALRPSPSPEPAEEPASRTERCLHGGRNGGNALYLVMKEQQGHGVVSGYYAVHRIDLAHSRYGISVSGEELDESAVACFQAAPGMSFVRMGSKIVGVTDKDAGVVKAESVVIDAGTWEVSPGPPPSSTTYGLVELSGKVYAADMFTEEPRCEVLGSTSGAPAGWSPLPQPPFHGRIVSLAAYPPRRGLLVSTERHESYLLDGRRRGGAAWVALSGSATLPLGERAVYAKDHDLWFEVSPRDGRLRAHDVAVVGGAGEANLEHSTHRVSDPVPVITPSARGGTTRSAKLVYLGSSKFCVVQAAAERDGAGADGCRVTVTVFRVVDSEMPVTLAERRRRREGRGMNAGWVAAELERACADKASASGRRRRKLCRVNLWSRTYIVCGGAGQPRRPSLAGVLWI